MATSFPYLQVARTYDVDYWRVLQFADLLNNSPPKPEDWGLPHLWMVATCLAFRHEQNRRMSTSTPKTVQWSAINDPTSWEIDPSAGSSITISVRGDCGQIHPTVKGWQDCAACGAILKSRVGRPARWPHED